MKIDIAKVDLWHVRDMLYKERQRILSSPNPSACRDQPEVALKIIKKLNQALTKVYGHDCYGESYIM